MGKSSEVVVTVTTDGIPTSHSVDRKLLAAEVSSMNTVARLGRLRPGEATKIGPSLERQAVDDVIAETELIDARRR